jgi:lipid-A-disaccharide synthase
LQPTLEVHGFGGERMTSAGCNLVYPLCDLATVGIFRVLAAVPRFYRVLSLADQHFRQQRPDALVLIDFPGFHWWLARCAHSHGIPVLYFVPPQLWAWASWRVRKMRRLVDHVLCTLPFEETWYRQHNVPAQYIGHPYFDELRQQRLEGGFVADQRRRPGTIVALLPGSRRSELTNNTPTLIRAAQRIHQRRPDVRFLTACLRPQHKQFFESQLAGLSVPIEVHAGRTPEIIHLAHSCIAVSGSVSLELLYRGKPSAVVYREHLSGILLARLLKRCRYISLVNLLADKLLFPEYLTHRCQGEALAEHILHWLNDRTAYELLRGDLSALREKVAKPGACERAADCVLQVLRENQAKPRAA